MLVFILLSIQIHHNVEKRIDLLRRLIQAKTGLNIEYRDLEVNFGSIQLEGITVGPDSLVVLSSINIETDLNPFSSDFARAKKITIEQANVRAQFDVFFRYVKKFAPLFFSLQSSKKDLAKEKNNWLLKVLPRDFIVKNSGFVLIDDQGKEILQTKGGSFLVDQTNSQILFKIKQIKAPQLLIEKNLSGSLKFKKKTKSVVLRIRKTEDDNKEITWEMQGEVARDLSLAKADFSGSEIPGFLSRYYKAYVQKISTGHYEGSIFVQRQQQGDFSFKTEVKSTDFGFSNELLSKRPLRPQPVSLNLTGTWRRDEGELLIDDGGIEITLPTPNGNETEEPRTARLQITTLGKKTEDGSIWRTYLSLPTSSCQNIFEATMSAFTTTLNGFKMAGEIGGTAEIIIDTANPENFSYKLIDHTFTCQVTSAPDNYSKELLSGPFVITREVKDGSTVEIRLSPLSDSFVPLAYLPKDVISAFVMSEDAGFWHHQGIDFFAIEQAIKRNLAEEKVVLGGSTITMQTAKNLFLFNERTIGRKIQEVFLAWYLESILTKQRILEIYLNIVEVGPQLYGIASAAKHFFAKSPMELTLTDAAYLASVLPSPIKRYVYFCNGAVTENFDKIVKGLLKRMFNLNTINHDKYVAAFLQPIRFRTDARYSQSQCLSKMASRSAH